MIEKRSDEGLRCMDCGAVADPAYPGSEPRCSRCIDNFHVRKLAEEVPAHADFTSIRQAANTGELHDAGS